MYIIIHGGLKNRNMQRLSPIVQDKQDNFAQDVRTVYTNLITYKKNSK